MGVSADFVLNYGHKSRFNLLRSVVFELFVMLMGGGLVGWALLLTVVPPMNRHYVSQICHKLDTEIIVAAQGKES